MAHDAYEDVFTKEMPLGPSAIVDEIDPAVLRALYDDRVEQHIQSRRNPPTFIVGRRGSGKTALLLSVQLDADNVVATLSRHNTFLRVQLAVELLRDRVLLTEEGVADLWELLLWGPIAVRLASRRDRRDDPAAYQLLWGETAPLRTAVAAASHAGIPDDDLIVERLLELLCEEILRDPPILGTDTLVRRLKVHERSWGECIEAARTILHARRANVYVLIDSLENIGTHLDRLELTIRGLFHLVGRIGVRPARRSFQLRCCFPSELWPLLTRLSANPMKDLAGKIVLQWKAADLLQSAALRLKHFVDLTYPELADAAGPDGSGLWRELLPGSVTNRLGVREPCISYMLRHTQLLPRQFINILNVALHGAIAERGSPRIEPADVVDAVAEVEATLCPEIFAAHAFQYPSAFDVAERLIPFLPFRFDDGMLHRMCGRASIERDFGMDYRKVREMLTRLGIIGRFVSAEETYVIAEFGYTVEGQLVLSPNEDYCLHPLFVRQFSSDDVANPKPDVRPVYPHGTPLPHR
jgi:hypothetical protein